MKINVVFTLLCSMSFWVVLCPNWDQGVEFYLYVFVRNDNILDLLVTIAAGILFIVLLTLYIVHLNRPPD